MTSKIATGETLFTFCLRRMRVCGGSGAINLKMKIILVLNILFLINLASCGKSVLKKVAFVIMSQPHKRHSEIADETFRKLKTEFSNFGIENPKIFVTHKDFPLFGAWTYFPLFKRECLDR